MAIANGSSSTTTSNATAPLSAEVQLVQPEDYSDFQSSASNTAPIFLIHDGGGTVFPYHNLGQLHRFTYGIPNPLFASGGLFAGGIPEMTRLYADSIVNMTRSKDYPLDRNPEGSHDILVGGWSFGGVLSLEVARLLREEPDVHVVGIIMVDSICPRRPAPPPVDATTTETAASSSSSASSVPKTTFHLAKPKTNNEILSQQCIAASRIMVPAWTLPDWNDEYSPRPPAVLIKARGYIPPESPEDKLHSLDILREDSTIGWGAYDKKLFVRVIETDGNHFDLFSVGRIQGTTLAIRKALATIDP